MDKKIRLKKLDELDRESRELKAKYVKRFSKVFSEEINKLVTLYTTAEDMNEGYVEFISSLLDLVFYTVKISKEALINWESSKAIIKTKPTLKEILTKYLIVASPEDVEIGERLRKLKIDYIA